MRKRLLLLAALLAGCLPEDTRPPPTEVSVTLRGAPSTINGVTTSDGWTIKFERVLVTIGGVDVEGDACDEYADADYFRILDAQLDKPQKIGLIYGLGTCEFQARARNPEADSLLGENVSEELKTVMREPGKDPYEEFAGITYLVRGRATRGPEQKSFFWLFRRRRVSYDRCSIDGLMRFPLTENGKKAIELTVHAETLFWDHFRPDRATLKFDHFAAADADGDGAITIEELAAVKLAGLNLALNETPSQWSTFGEFFYDGLFPRIIQIGDPGTCEIEVRPREMR